MARPKRNCTKCSKYSRLVMRCALGYANPATKKGKENIIHTGLVNICPFNKL